MTGEEEILASAGSLLAMTGEIITPQNGGEPYFFRGDNFRYPSVTAKPEMKENK